MAPSLQGGRCLIVQNDQSDVTDAAVSPAVLAIFDCTVQCHFMGLQGPVLRVFSASHYHDVASHEPTTTALASAAPHQRRRQASGPRSVSVARRGPPVASSCLETFIDCATKNLT